MATSFLWRVALLHWQRNLLKVRGGGHFAKLKWFSIGKNTFLWRGFKFKRGHSPPGPLFLPPSYAFLGDKKYLIIMICLWSKSVGDKPVISQALVGYHCHQHSPSVSCNKNDILYSCLWYNHHLYHYSIQWWNV